MKCLLCSKEIDPAEMSAGHLAKWEQVTASTFRGGSLLLLQGDVCPACAAKLQPGSVALSFVKPEESK